ncbi:MAG: hypothetical protein AB8B48_00475 [Pseudomonadales bacterium]
MSTNLLAANVKRLLLAGALIVLSMYGYSDPSVSDQVYSASYFDRFAPRTARDMLNQVPGFLPREIEDSRGLGQASSNILINGARSSGKQDSALAELSRLPANSVLKIVIRDGASLGIPGLSGDVADVLVNETISSGTWLWRTHHRDRIDSVWPRFEVSMTGALNDWTWRVNAQNKQDRLGHWGDESVFGPDGAVTETRDEFVTYNTDRPAGAVALSWTPESGDVANLSLSYRQTRSDNDESSYRLPENGSNPSLRYFDFVDNKWVAELSGDYLFAFADTSLKIIAYQRFERAPRTVTTEVFDLEERELSRQIFRRRSNAGESILRSEYMWGREESETWQLAVEGVFNFIDANSLVLSSQDGDPLVSNEIANGSSRVEERRYQATLSHGRALGARTRAQLTLGVEQSSLEQSGDSGLQREFTRPKGQLSLSHQLSSATLLSARLAREVGQLNFFDFISSVNLDTNNAAAGNPDLVPPQIWLLELQLEQQVSDHGNVSLTFKYEDIEDIVDQIPIGNSEAAGNLDSAKRFGMQWVSTLYLDGMGLKGGQLRLDYLLQRSELDDPLTGEKRRINDDRISNLFAELRHDIPASDWAWGVNYSRFREADVFRLDERSHEASNLGEAKVFVEHKNLFGMKLNISVRNLLDSNDQFERSVYVDRRDGPLSFRENRFRKFGPVYEIQLEGNF